MKKPPTRTARIEIRTTPAALAAIRRTHAKTYKTHRQSFSSWCVAQLAAVQT